MNPGSREVALGCIRQLAKCEPMNEEVSTVFCFKFLLAILPRFPKSFLLPSCLSKI